MSEGVRRRLTILHQSLLDALVDRDVGVLVFRQVSGIVRDVQTDRVVSGFGDEVSVVFQGLVVS